MQVWIIANAAENLFRTWSAEGPRWTDSRDEATWYVRKTDAEKVSENDEDAWKILPHQTEK